MVHDVIQELEELYAELPTINCKGLCWNSCGPIDLSDAERQRIVDLGVDIPVFTEDRARRWANDEKGELYCPALSFGAHEGGMGCTAYEARPMICRLWGLSEGDMSCPHGCEPSTRLTPAEVYRFIGRSFKIGGHGDVDVDRGLDVLEALMSDPDQAEIVTRFMGGDHSVAAELRTAVENHRRA
jgi:Fe-S-cluster containining protein